MFEYPICVPSFVPVYWLVLLDACWRRRTRTKRRRWWRRNDQCYTDILSTAVLSDTHRHNYRLCACTKRIGVLLWLLLRTQRDYRPIGHALVNTELHTHHLLI